MVCFSLSIQQHKQVYNWKANDVGEMHNEQMESFTCLHAQITSMVSLVINTLIDTFLSKLCTFLKEKGRPMMVKKKQWTNL